MKANIRTLAGAAALLCASCRGAADRLQVSGTIEIRQLRLAPLTYGRLERLLKDEGDTVHRGDTLAVLSQPGLDALITQRRAQVEAATLRVAEVAAAQADSERAAKEFARAGPLLQQSIISQQQYDGMKTAAAAASARLAARRAASSEVAVASAAVAAVVATRDELTIIAPDDGVILSRYADPGEALATGTPVLSLGLVHRPWIRAYIGDRYVGRLKVGGTASVHVDAYPDQTFQGRIVEIGSQAEFTPRVALTERERADLVFGIKVEPTDADAGGRLKAGMPVTLDIPLMP
jgi:HlyD family secretion protein